MSNVIRINSICPCDSTAEGGFNIFLPVGVYQAGTIVVNQLTIYNQTTSQKWATGPLSTITVTDEGVIGVYTQLKAVLDLDPEGILPQGRYCMFLDIDFTSTTGVPLHRIEEICTVSLCVSEEQLMDDFVTDILSTDCETDCTEYLKEIYWEAYTMYRVLKILDPCGIEENWDLGLGKLSGLLTTLKKDLCVNC